MWRKNGKIWKILLWLITKMNCLTWWKPLKLNEDTVWKPEKFTFTEKILREINSLVKTLLSRNFCQKKCDESKFLQFSFCGRSCVCWFIISCLYRNKATNVNELYILNFPAHVLKFFPRWVTAPRAGDWPRNTKTKYKQNLSSSKFFSALTFLVQIQWFLEFIQLFHSVYYCDSLFKECVLVAI